MYAQIRTIGLSAGDVPSLCTCVASKLVEQNTAKLL